MSRCDICGKDLAEERKYLLFGTVDGQRWYICKSCERLLNLVTDGRRKRWIHLAVAELRYRMAGMEDLGLREFLRTLIETRERRVGMHRCRFVNF